jgi:hypothetical protein
MMSCVGVRARLWTLSFWLNLVLFLVSAYLAVAVVLSDHDVPSKDAWRPWHLPFLSLVVAGVYVAGFTFYEYFRTQKAADSQLDKDVSCACQVIAWRVIGGCEKLDPAKLAVGVWLARRRGSFDDRRMRFLLPTQRPTSTIAWRRGVGVVGSLWASPDESACLEKLVTRNAMTAEDFAKLPPADRLGLTYVQWQNVKNYTGVVAVKLIDGASKKKKLLGFLVIDYSGSLAPITDGHDILDSIGDILEGDQVRQYRGALVDLLKKGG